MKATIRDQFTDTCGRQFEAEWSFHPDRPLVVELILTSQWGHETTWVIDRSRLPWSLRCCGDVSLGVSGPRLIVIFRPMTIHAVTMVGALRVAEEFAAAAEQLVPYCPGCDVDGCRSCAAVAESLDTALAAIAGEAA